jgi:hypothetical protein
MVVAELKSMPCLRSLQLPATCAARAVDAEAVCGLTTLTMLGLYDLLSPGNGHGEGPGKWILDLSRLTTLTTLKLQSCRAVTDKEVQSLSNLTGLTNLSLFGYFKVTAEGLRAVSSLTGLTKLNFTYCAAPLVFPSPFSSLLLLYHCLTVTNEGLRAVIK